MGSNRAEPRLPFRRSRSPSTRRGAGAIRRSAFTPGEATKVARRRGLGGDGGLSGGNRSSPHRRPHRPSPKAAARLLAAGSPSIDHCAAVRERQRQPCPGRGGDERHARGHRRSSTAARAFPRSRPPPRRRTEARRSTCGGSGASTTCISPCLGNSYQQDGRLIVSATLYQTAMGTRSGGNVSRLRTA